MSESAIRCQCRVCGHRFEAPATTEGKDLECPTCGRTECVIVQDLRVERSGQRDEGPSPDRDPDSARTTPMALLSEARTLLKEDRHREVVDVCDRVLADPTEPIPEYENEREIGHYLHGLTELTCYSTIYKALGLKEKSILALVNHRAEAWFLRGYALIELGDLDEAVTCIRKALEFDKTNTTYLDELGHCFQGMGMHDKAIEAFRESIRLCETLARFPTLAAELREFYLLGKRLVVEGSKETGNRMLTDAQSYYESLRSMNRSDEARAWRGIGFSLIECDLWDKAEDAFKESLKLEPDNATATSELDYIRMNRPVDVSSDPPEIRAIQEAIVETTKELTPNIIRSSIEAAIEKGISPEAICERGIVTGLRLVRERCDVGRIYIPETIAVAKELETGIQCLEERMRAPVIHAEYHVAAFLATGDLHFIPLKFLELFFKNDGFPFDSLGADLSPEDIVKHCRERGIRILLGSATLSATRQVLGTVAEILKQEGLTNNIAYIVGGGAVHPGFAKEIGAIGYTPTACEAVTVAKQIWKIDKQHS